jgi:hypothetical protein
MERKMEMSLPTLEEAARIFCCDQQVVRLARRMQGRVDQSDPKIRELLLDAAELREWRLASERGDQEAVRRILGPGSNLIKTLREHWNDHSWNDVRGAVVRGWARKQLDRGGPRFLRWRARCVAEAPTPKAENTKQSPRKGKAKPPATTNPAK